MLRHPNNLDEAEQVALKQFRAAWTHLDNLIQYVNTVAKILTRLRGDQLGAWIDAVQTNDRPELHSFVTDLKRDHRAVLNALILPYSSGAVEDHVNQIIQMLKRQMYCRAKFDLSENASFSPRNPNRVNSFHGGWTRSRSSFTRRRQRSLSSWRSRVTPCTAG